MRKIITLYLLLVSALGFSQSQTLTIQTVPTIQTPIASSTQSGLVKIGANLFIDAIGNVTRLAESGNGGAVLVTLNNTTNFATFNVDTATIVVVTDTITRGVFSIYTGMDSADGGMVFNDAIGRKWKRLTKDNKIYLRWYGVVTKTNYEVDVAPIIKKAIKYVKTHKNQFQILQLDPGEENTWYLIGSTLDISGIKLIGAGGAGRRTSTLFQVFPRVQAFYIAKEFTEVRDITVRHYATAAPIPDSTFHTFVIRSRVRFENVIILANPDGNGYQILGDDSTLGSPRYSVFVNCQATYCHNGGFVKGKDAGNIIFELCNFYQNATWGVFDMSEIGNVYLTTHFATNSEGRNNTGARTADVRTFYPYPDSVYNIVGKHPDSFPTYWYKTNFTGGNQLFDPTRKYFGGGPLYANHPKASHQIISNYTEDFQANSIINNNSVWYEGTSGSPVAGGMRNLTFQNVRYYAGGVGSGIDVDTTFLKTLSLTKYLNNDADYFYKLSKHINATTSNVEVTLPQESGTLALSRVHEYDREPTTVDIPLNTFKFWINLAASPQTLRIWVNLNGTLRIFR